MSSIENTKVFAAVLTAGIAFSMSGFISTLLVSPERLHHAAIQIGDVGGEAPPPAAAPPEEPIGNLLASADPDRGKQLAQRQCGSCHTFTEGGANGVGPNLYGIIGAHHAHAAGFNYSAGMKARGEEPWGYEDMNAWLRKPSSYVSGTRMAFAGLSNNQQRADVIAFLRSISPSAPPPPAPVEAPAAQPASAPASAPADTAPGTPAPAAPGGGAPRH